MSNPYSHRQPRLNLPEMAGRDIHGAATEVNRRAQNAMPDLEWTAMDSLKLALSAGAEFSIAASKIPHEEKKEIVAGVLQEAKAIGAGVADRLHTALSIAAEDEGEIGQMLRQTTPNSGTNSANSKTTPPVSEVAPPAERAAIIRKIISSVHVSDRTIDGLTKQLNRLGKAFVIGGIIVGAWEVLRADDMLLETGQQVSSMLSGFLAGGAAVMLLSSAGVIAAGSFLVPAIVALLAGVATGYVVEQIYNAITGYDG